MYGQQFCTCCIFDEHSFIFLMFGIVTVQTFSLLCSSLRILLEVPILNCLQTSAVVLGRGQKK